MPAPSYAALKAHEWHRWLLRCVGGLILFETLTGLAIYLLPFSVPNQMVVLFHTAAGIAFVVPFLWYQLRHWSAYRSLRLSHVVLTGYFAMVAMVTLIVSGLVLTAQAIFATRIAPGWDRIHVIATFALVIAVVPHVATLMLRAARALSEGAILLRAATRRFALGSLLLAAGLALPILVAATVYRAPELTNALPRDYSYLFGATRPFAPSLATTTTKGAFDSRTLAGSASCGTSGCHKEIYDEWSTSAHRWAAMDPAFQKVQSVMGEQNGPESTRYCGGCHDPISLFSGTKNIFTKDLTNLAGYREGVSCVSCHAIRSTDVKGNAAYVISQPTRYLFELDSAGGIGREVSNFIIRAYPRHHVETLQRTMFKSPEFCAACHKQFIDEEINRVGWVQLQNQYDNWRKSRWNHPRNPAKTIECRECHMPLVASSDPSSGDARDYNRSPGDGMHRSHRFLGANQFIPTQLGLPGAAEHRRLTEKWLRGEIPIPEIAQKWRTGPAVPIELSAPPTAAPGQPITLHVALTNNKVGHEFPTGPLDIIQAWVELTVSDDSGRVVYQTGQRDSANFITPGAFMLKAEPVDQYGNLIDRHNLWEMVGVRYRRSVFPGFSDMEQFTFRCPPSRAHAGATVLHARARLMYRKIDQYLLNFLFGRESGITAPVTVISEDQRMIRVVTPARAGTD